MEKYLACGVMMINLSKQTVEWSTVLVSEWWWMMVMNDGGGEWWMVNDDGNDDDG